MGTIIVLKEKLGDVGLGVGLDGSYNLGPLPTLL
jgi:hypothetical protein